MTVPAQPKIYHICHLDRLPSIIASTGLLSDAVLLNQALPGTVNGMNHIKQRCLQLELDSHLCLHVGERFETPFGLELLATVHWIVKNGEPVSSVADVITRTYGWNIRKKLFTPRQIGIAVDVLKNKGWIEPTALYMPDCS